MLDEQRLILTAVLLHKKYCEVNAIDDILTRLVDWSYIAGQVVNHRLGGYFYLGLLENQIVKMPKELKSSLGMIVKAQKLDLQKKALEYAKISEIFDIESVRYAVTKGLVFCADMYCLGCRRCSDFDIFVVKGDFNKLDAILKDNGYNRVRIEGNQCVNISANDISLNGQKNNTPAFYRKQLGADYICLDITYEFDGVENSISESIYSLGQKTYCNNALMVKGLPFYSHLIYLCVSFYSEEIVKRFSKYLGPIAIYKLVDIFNLIRFNLDYMSIDNWCMIVKKYHLENKCRSVFELMQHYYPSDVTIRELARILTINTGDMLSEHKISEDEMDKFLHVLYDRSFIWVT